MTLIVYFIFISASIYCLLILVFRWGLGTSRLDGGAGGKPLPNISVIVPMRNEECSIGTLMESISKFDYPRGNFEVIVVNDQSTDSSPDIVKDWSTRMGNLELVNLTAIEAGGKKQALTKGVLSARYDLVVLTDADCTVPSTWLISIAGAHAATGFAMAVGPVFTKGHGGIFNRMQALEHASLTACSLGACGAGIPIMASGANLAFNRQVVGFEASLLCPSHPSGDDMFLLHSVKSKGIGPIVALNTPGAAIYTNSASTLREFFRQRARWASKAHMYRDIPTIASAIIVFTTNTGILLLLILGALGLLKPMPLVLITMAKWLVDLLILHKFLGIYQQRSLLKVFLPLQLIYPIYIAITIFQSLTLALEWKNRYHR